MSIDARGLAGSAGGRSQKTRPLMPPTKATANKSYVQCSFALGMASVKCVDGAGKFGLRDVEPGFVFRGQRMREQQPTLVRLADDLAHA